MVNHRERVTRVLTRIEEGFRGVSLGDGVSLHETVVIDCYGSGDERRAAREPDEKDDWRNLIDDPELIAVCGVGGPTFFDAVGFRFHLPAYLSLIAARLDSDPVLNIQESLMVNLDPKSDHCKERLAILSPDQRRCVREFLVLVRDMWESDDRGLNESIEGHRVE
jgi:hypothetical protein